jgi:nicotinamidase-related amidase
MRLDADLEMAAEFAERGFGNRIGFGARPALLVIDFLVGFTDPALPLGSDLEREINATRVLLDAARASGVTVLHTAVSYDEEAMRDAGIWAIKQARGVATLRAGSPATEIDPRVGRRHDEPIINKKYASAFFGTDLVSRLVTRGVDTLVIAGCTTSGCVRATAVDACQLGLRPMVVREAVGDRAEAAHRQSLFDLDQKYADVVDLDRTAAYLRDAAG